MPITGQGQSAQAFKNDMVISAGDVDDAELSQRYDDWQTTQGCLIQAIRHWRLSSYAEPHMPVPYMPVPYSSDYQSCPGDAEGRGDHMTVVYLDSSEDRRLAPYRDLPGRPKRGDGKQFIVEGQFLVERLLASTLPTESIVTDPSRVASLRHDIGERTTIFVLPADKINQLVGFDFHRGMLACGTRGPLPAIDECLPAPPNSTLLVVCSQVVDPVNLGGILRNCAAFGAKAVLLGPGCADPFSRRVLRVSMGAVFKLAIATSEDLATDLRRLTDLHKLTLVATVLDEDAEPLDQVEWMERIGLVIGNEGFGLSDETISICQRKVTIPIESDVDSLNAAVASGVMLYHFSRRRG
jgi:tRNA G18 (ribose-2'-O)-methylase SpoU